MIYAATSFTILSMPVSFSFPFLFYRLSRWADVVHWHEPFPLATASAWLLRIPRKSIITWHCDIVRQKYLRHVAYFFHCATTQSASAVVTTSQATADNSPILRRLGEPVHIIPIGISLEALRAVGHREEEEWLQSRKPIGRYALFVGRLVYYKGLDVLLSSLEKSRATVVVVGSGPLAGHVRKAASAFPEKLIYIDRPVSNLELALFYKHCDFLVLPSTMEAEAFGIVQVEAMAFGKPVINTYLPTGVPDVSVHEITGLTVPPRDPEALALAMDTLWSDRCLAASLGDEARRRANALFSEDKMIDQYNEIIQQMVTR